jgi:uncharacterized protein (TIRG00374 family)
MSVRRTDNPAVGNGAADPNERDPFPPDPKTEELEASMSLGGRRIAVYAAVVLALVVGLYVGLPAAFSGLSDSLDRVGDANGWWLAVALGLNVLSFFAYIALFRGIVGGQAETGAVVGPRLDWSVSYQVTLAGLAATRLFAAAGAGGVALTYWALRRAGMERRDAGCRMVAFLSLLYLVYMLSIIVFGVLLRVGLLPGPSPVTLTIVPAALAGVVIVIFLLISLIPEDVERRLADWSRGYRRRAVLLRRLASGPALVAEGARIALGIVRHPSQGVLAITGAVGFWAANIAVLWACFHAFGEAVPKGVLVQGFFIGMTANLLPFFPGGVGSVDAGMIGAFLAFGEPSSTVVVSVLAYRVIAFWLPIPPGVVAYIQLRRTVGRWRAEEMGAGTARA